MAVVHGAAFGLSPNFRASYATSDDGARGGVHPHPALLRQSELSAADGVAAG